MDNLGEMLYKHFTQIGKTIHSPSHKISLVLSAEEVLTRYTEIVISGSERG